jgi:hypothetical protein
MISGDSTLMPYTTKMIRKHYASVSFLILILILAVSCTDKQDPYRVHTFRSGNGWGYNIVVNKKIFIHQPSMPAFEGNIPFKNKQQAKKTGELVVDKLRAHKVPSVSREELRSIIKE